LAHGQTNPGGNERYFQFDETQVLQGVYLLLPQQTIQNVSQLWPDDLWQVDRMVRRVRRLV
jgi:diadenosine tetraphosphate (Ap4A) HIT family hydrolase